MNSPNAANAYLNYGFAYVNKIPAAGAITQVILLADTAPHLDWLVHTANPLPCLRPLDHL